MCDLHMPSSMGGCHVGSRIEKQLISMPLDRQPAIELASILLKRFAPFHAASRAVARVDERRRAPMRRQPVCRPAAAAASAARVVVAAIACISHTRWTPLNQVPKLPLI